MQNNSKLQTLLLVAVIALIGFGFWMFTEKSEKGSNNKAIGTQIGERIIDENPTLNNNDYQPIQNSENPAVNSSNLITDSVGGFSFKTINEGVAIKGAAHCCPLSWSVQSADSASSEGLEKFIPGSTEDPKNWAIATYIGSQTYGPNTFEIYMLTNSDGTQGYEFTLVVGSKGLIITTKTNPPTYIDLSSIKIY